MVIFSFLLLFVLCPCDKSDLLLLLLTFPFVIAPVGSFVGSFSGWSSVWSKVFTTIILHVAVIFPFSLVAVISAVPNEWAVISPHSFTVATSLLLLAK